MSQNFQLLGQLEADFRFAGAAPREIPSAVNVSDRGATTGRFSSELLTLAQKVFLSGDAGAPRAVVVCGVDRDSASSEICIGLARILSAYSPRPVCLVDAQSRVPRLDQVLDGGQPFPEQRQEHSRKVASNLWVADIDMTGTSKEIGLGSEPDAKQQLADLRRRFDFVLIDAPGVASCSDAALLAQQTDGAILVIEANVTRKVAALRARQAFEAMNVRIFGSVLNNRSFPIPEKLYRKL